MSRFIAVAVLALATIAVVAGSSLRVPHRGVSEASSVLYTRTLVPSGWTQGARAAVTSPVEFTIGLTQRNLDILDKWFWETSDPKNVHYQEFKTIDEISDLVSPKPSETAKVMSWLKSHGVQSAHIKSFGDALDVKCPVAVAEKLFATQFYTFSHTETGAKVTRQFGSYSVPASVKAQIQLVSGISTFPVPHLRVHVAGPLDANYGIVPQTIDHLYQISSEARSLYSSLDGSIVPTQGVIEFQGENFAQADVTAEAQGEDITANPVAAADIIGPNDQTNPQVEAELDIEMIATIDTAATSWFWLESGNGWLYQFGVHFFNTTDVPMVNSISYGWWEGDQCTIDPTGCSQLGVTSDAYVARVDIQLQKIALRGISLLVSSGDSGANGRSDDGCTASQLRASYPASSPFVTAVGATELVDATNLVNPPPICASAGVVCALGGTEQAVSFAISSFASGGGFSTLHPMPSYQTKVVDEYLSGGTVLPPASYFNASGRAYPDVSAQGHNVIIVSQGSPQTVGGTSCSSPIFASIVSLLNVAQLAATGKPLGFLNPLLYQMQAEEPETFHDITVGDNKCTEDGCSGCDGYICAVGWDPVTGLGTPNFEKMLAYVKKAKHTAVKRS